MQKPNGNGGRVCQHDYRLNEEIGIICRLCGFVCTEIKDVSLPFVSRIIVQGGRVFHFTW